VRAGQLEQGFSELRLAAASNSALQPPIIDLAWQLSRGDVTYVREAIRPNTPQGYMDVADFFKRHDKFSDAVDVIRDAGSLPSDYRRKVVDELISAKRFEDAYRLWSFDHPASTNSPNLILNGDFETASDLDEPGFGWRGSKTQNISLTLDDNSPKQGRFSFKAEFKGESNPSILSQLIMVNPGAHYELKFTARTEHLVSGGLPRLLVLNASTGAPVGQALIRQRDLDGWRDYLIDFDTSQETSTIQIVLGRESCSNSPCPIYGSLWLDNCFLQKK
jgi:hypothetical protein